MSGDNPLSKIPDELVKAVAERVHERLRGGGAISPPRLPASKQGFPKLLCLDMNWWVALARAHHGRSDAADAAAALAAIRDATQRGSLVVPIQGVNAMEVAEPGDEARRSRMADAIVEISRNVSMMSPITTSGWEIERAVHAAIGGDASSDPVRPRLLCRGVYPAIVGKEFVWEESGSTSANALATETLREPEISSFMLTHGTQREVVARLRTLDDEGAERVRKIKANDAAMAPEAKRRLETQNVMRSPRIASKIREAFLRHGGTEEALRALMDDTDRLIALAAAIPDVDAEGTLILAYHRNPTQPIESNDFKDISFLKQAIPYANVVVTEKQWAHFSTREGLSARYDTRVLGGLGELPAVLAALGCIA